MPRTASTSFRLAAAAAAVALAASLAGCATPSRGTSAANGPEHSLYGRISVRKVGQPLMSGSYTWHRGRGLNGWTESIDLTDPRGLTFLEIDSDDNGTIAQYLDRTVKVPNVRYLLRTEMGVDLAPATLASWLANDYAGGAVPDKFRHEEVVVEIIERDGKGRPYKVFLRHGENLVVMVVRREFDD